VSARWHVLVSQDEPYPSTVSYVVEAPDQLAAVFRAAVRHAVDGGGEEVDQVTAEPWAGQ
jgi:hypothetical protein